MKHPLLLTVLLGVSCTSAKEAADELLDGVTVDITGNLDVSGDTPADFSFTLYGVTDNLDAFDASYCGDSVGADCYGRLDVSALTTETEFGSYSVNGNALTLSDVPVDLAYVLVATGNDSAVNCTTDVMGFDETTKIVNADSAISLGIDGVTLPRDINFFCEAPITEPTPPADPEPEEVAEEGTTDDDGNIGAPVDPEWTVFQITDKSGATIYGDASTESVTADITCDSNFPAVLNIYAETDNTSATEAFIRIQFDDGGTFTTVAAPINNGVVDQAISLTGGFSIVQMDLDESLDGVGESNTISFCEPDDAPAQEILTILTWDKDDTDVDTHILSNGEEVAYYSMSQSWGDLDIDDVNGFGPETFTSSPGTEGQNYEVKVHYYSDHGNGDTNVTMRVVYYDSSTGSLCDISATETMTSYGWWTVGMFGPGLTCPE